MSSQAQTAPERTGEMNAETRARIAYVAGKMICESQPEGIFDRNLARFLTAGVDMTIPSVSTHTPQKACTVKRTPGACNFCMVDDCNHHVCLSIHGKLFDGFDHRTQSHFSGHVLDHDVSLFDYKVSDYFCYTI